MSNASEESAPADRDQLKDAEAALVWVRYLWDTGRCALGVELGARTASCSDSEPAHAIEFLGRARAFPELERICVELATKPAGYASGRQLGYELGRLRWLPPLVPLLRSQPFERACLAIHGAVEAMMGQAEPGDATRIMEVLVPAAREIDTHDTSEPKRRRAAQFRHWACSELAAALAKLDRQDAARTLIEGIRAELDGLDTITSACARAGLAPALVALGELQQAEELLRRAQDDLDAYFDDDVDDWGVPWFDVVARDRARAAHLSTWRHGTPWGPIEPVSRRFTGPVTVRLFPIERAAQKAWSHAIDFHSSATRLYTGLTHVAAAMDVVDAARKEQPDYVPWLIAHLAARLDQLDDTCATRLVTWLDTLRPVADERAAYATAVAAGAGALARSGRGEMALVQAMRVENPWLRLRAGIEAVCAIAAKRGSREKARVALTELLAEPVSNGGDWIALGKRILADLDAPHEQVPLVITMTGADSGTFRVPEQMMALVLTFGNGLEGDVRITANVADAVLLARGLIMGAGSCRRIAPPSDSTLFRPGDECYRQHETARVFLDTTPIR